ncbi:MAG: response regulator [Methylobacteriaceae bacterium]|nr:response regulator [Methylobacteriaceae bacterium]
MRLYFTEFKPSSGPGGVRPLQFLAVFGSGVIALAMTMLLGTSPLRAFLWWLAIGVSEAAIIAINGLYARRQPDDSQLRAWALAKAALAGVSGLAWSAGQIALPVQGDPVSTIMPAWMILTFCAGAIWAGAFYTPALVAMQLCAILPAALWLEARAGFDRAVGLCLLATLPMLLAIGRQAARRYRSTVNDKIEIGLLLEQQNAYTQKIEELSAERGRFFGAAAHDLRQPLHAMGLYLSLLRDNPAAVDRDNLLDSLAACAKSLDAQFNAIMGVQETSALISRAQVQPTALADLFERLAVQARPKAMEAGLDLRVAHTGLVADVAPDILERVLNNLLSNALRYTKRGGVLIGARRRGDEIAIEIVDTGVGIPEERRADVFEDFLQLDNPERNRARGFGLGLGIVRRLCEGMGWRIELHSRVGRGSRFAIVVPMARAAPVHPQPATALSQPVIPAVQGRRALVVDDDVRVLDAMRKLLARWGVEAQFCETGDCALAALAAGDPQARWHVLIDYRLAGGETGLALAGRIRERFGERVACVLVTGEVDEALEQRAAAQNFVILRKPVEPIRLRALLAR